MGDAGAGNANKPTGRASQPTVSTIRIEKPPQRTCTLSRRRQKLANLVHWRDWRRHCAALLATCASASHAAPPEITWYIPDLPPHYVVEAGRKEVGFHQQALQKQFMPALGDYKHSTKVASVGRVLAMLKSDPNACIPSAVKTPEREQFMVFSRPSLAMIPPGLFVRAGDAHKFTPLVDASGRISLEALLARGDFVLGVEGQRRYGAGVDKLVEARTGSKAVYQVNFQAAARSLMRMAAVERVDGVLGYPYEATWHLNDRSWNGPNKLHFYELTEQPRFNTSYVACSNSELGKAVIAQLNARLDQASTRAAIAGHYETWLTPEFRAESKRIQKLLPDR